MENYQTHFFASPSLTWPTSDLVKEAVEFDVGACCCSKYENENENEASISREKMIEKAKSGTKKGNDKAKRHKFAFQTRSHVDVLDDGYRWRKYGQKTVKNSKFPRSYYKCTFQGCNVKKQIQRLCNDQGIVMTTYEGMHSHSIHQACQTIPHLLTQIQTSYTPF